jgi:hypothetical protein
MSAMIQKVFSAGTLLNPVALNGFIDAAVASVTTDERLDRDTIAALGGRAGDVDLGKVVFTTVPVSDGDHLHEGESTVLWNSEAATAMFSSLAADQPLPTPPKATAVEVPPGDITVAVAAVGAQGGNAVTDLTDAGYQVTTTGPGSVPTTTTVRFDPAFPKSLATVKAALPTATFVEAPGIGDTFQLTIGSDYTGIEPVRSLSTGMDNTVRSAKDDICG